jgi:LacI family repressor for deo operon, udp, cdd, tsx, nupC, and nupG
LQTNIKITDVAELAGVSPATVSRVLTNNVNVSEKTKRRVNEAITQLNYKPNRLASNLRRSSSGLIMVILPDISNLFFNEVIRGFQTVARKNGYHVLLASSDNDAEEEKRLLTLVSERVVDGVILTAVSLSQNELLELCRNIPVVLSCRYPEGSDIPVVSIDNITAAREATQYLIGLGHRRIATITGPLQVVISRDRLKGYKQAMEMEELPVVQQYIQEGDFSVQSGSNMMMKLLAMQEPPTAVFVASDEMAVGAIKAVKECGLRVPEDISICGFDGLSLGTLVEPNLTTIHQPKYEMGVQAMELLLQLLDKEMPERKQYVLPHRLLVRGSCRRREQS